MDQPLAQSRPVSRRPGKPQHVAVVGAGIVGVSTAIWLQRAGIEVTLIDRDGPAAGASHGNAGILAAGSVVPVTVPGLLRKAPGMLFNANAPLFLRWSYLPKLVPFLRKYLAHGTHTDVERISHGLFDLLHDTADQHLALARGTGAEPFVTVGDYLYGYRDKAAFEADAYGWSIRKARGIEFHEMTAAELDEYDPSVQGRFGYAVRCPHHGHISDPGGYVTALCDHFTAKGGVLKIAAVSGLRSEPSGPVLETSDGSVEADDVVIATGVWSKELMKKLGLSVPMESERGYHIEFVNPSIVPRSPIMVASGKFVMTPMEGRLRCAGIVEFGGLDAPPSRAPFDLLKRQTLEALPSLKYDRVDEWMGHRPSTSDSLPLIGALPNMANVWTGFGHQHIGLSGGPKTGRWLAQMICGETPNIDLKPFSPLRFQT